MQYMAVFDEYRGSGDSLEEAHQNLLDANSDAGYEPDNIAFYEVTPIQVEYKIVKKTTTVKSLVKSTKQKLPE